MAAALNVLYALVSRELLVVALAGVLLLLLAGGSIGKRCQRALLIEEKVELPDSR